MRAIHARLLFLGGLVAFIATGISSHLFLVPYLQSLYHKVPEAPTLQPIAPVPINKVYDKDCKIYDEKKKSGFAVKPPFATASGSECRERCLQYNDEHPTAQVRCDYFSWHDPAASNNTGSSVPARFKCHLISALSTITDHGSDRAMSGAVDCAFSNACLIAMRGVTRTGDTVIDRVDEPKECEQLCRNRTAEECLYWTLEARGKSDIKGEELDTCVLHRATKPGGTDQDAWPIQINRARLGLALLSGRTCPLTGLDLPELQNEVYERYGLPRPNLTLPSDSDSASGKFAPTSEQLSEWFYGNSGRDGGPYPTDPAPPKSNGHHDSAHTCPFGLIHWYRDRSLLELLGDDWDHTFQRTASPMKGTVVMSPSPLGQGLIRPYGGMGNDATIQELMAANGTDKVRDKTVHTIDLAMHDALWVISIKHVPVGCGVRRFLKLKSATGESEIVALDGVNYQHHMKASLTTPNDCDMSLPYLMNDWHPLMKPNQSGTFAEVKTNNEWSGEAGTKSWNCKAPRQCVVESLKREGTGEPTPIENMGGQKMNQNGGAILVVQVKRDRAIKIWNFAPEDVPNDLKMNAPDPDSWGLRPTKTVSGAEGWVAPVAMFPLVRGCEAMQGCEEADGVRCPHLLDVCPDSMRTLHKVTTFAAGAVGDDLLQQQLISGYNPVGCHGFKNFEALRLELGVEFCGAEASREWNRDPVCSLMNPLPLVEVGGPTIDQQCRMAQEDSWDSVLREAFWELYEIRVYQAGAQTCFNNSLLRVPPFIPNWKELGIEPPVWAEGEEAEEEAEEEEAPDGGVQDSPEWVAQHSPL